MAIFDLKQFNPQVFAKYVGVQKNLNRDEMIKSGAIVADKSLAVRLADGVGGNKLTIPVKARISGTPSNYDGATNIGSEARKTFSQTAIVIGRAYGWTEKDFSSDITGGNDFLPVAQEVAEYFDNVDQNTMLAILQGIFSMTGTENVKFKNKHTLDISAETTANKVDATSLNKAVQKALGDNKGSFRMAIMHSAVATNLENLQLLEYLKYTDKDGVIRDLSMATWNGRLVLIDDAMPVEGVYALTTDSAVDSSKTYYTRSGSGTVASPYVYTEVASPSTSAISTYYEFQYDKYTTYLFGAGAFTYADCGVKVPYEMDRDAKTNGGVTTLYARQRKLFMPTGISFKGTTTSESATDVELKTGTNWELANDGATNKTYIDDKHIAIARIVSRG